jgi:metallo-beta-lactamase class B
MSLHLRALIASFCLCFACLTAKAKDHSDWITTLPPFQIADNLYCVGSRDLAAYLITTPAGNILINANLESSPPLIRASVDKLGFSWKDTKVLLKWTKAVAAQTPKKIELRRSIFAAMTEFERDILRHYDSRR